MREVPAWKRQGPYTPRARLSNARARGNFRLFPKLGAERAAPTGLSNSWDRSALNAGREFPVDAEACEAGGFVRRDFLAKHPQIKNSIA
jgi:hypothetical protein